MPTDQPITKVSTVLFRLICPPCEHGACLLILRGGTTYPSCKGEFQIVRAECLVVDRRLQRLVEELRVAEEVLGDAEPQTEQLHYVHGQQAIRRLPQWHAGPASLAGVGLTGVEQII